MLCWGSKAHGIDDPVADMPEKKRVSIAPDAKGDGKKKQDSKQNSSQRDGNKSRNLNPIQRSKENINRSKDVRRAKGKYDDRIKTIVDEQESDRQYLVEQINIFRAENNKLMRQQTHKFGLTLDEMKLVKEELEQVKSTNDVLYNDLEARKEECDKLQAEVDYMEERLNAMMMDKYDLLHEKRAYKFELEQIEQIENQIDYLVKDNKTLRLQLLKNKIDPNADASKITSTSHTVDARSPKSDISRSTRSSRFPALNNKKRGKSPKSEGSKYESNDPNNPFIWTRKRLWTYKSMEDLRQVNEAEKQKQMRRSRSYHSQTIKQKSPGRKQGKGAWF